MPKMKSNRSAVKRFRLTATGKIRRNQAYIRHILTKKNPQAETAVASENVGSGA
jgi:large subunit ribosomal protein L35